MENILEQYNNLVEQGLYNKGAHKIADSMGLKMLIKGSDYRKHFPEDKQNRYVFKIQLKKDGKQYSFYFGQSIAEGSNEPTLYSVLACLQKYDVGSFEDFCGEFGYDEDSRQAERIYKAVTKEFKNMQRLFTCEELELLQEIQ